MQTGNVLIDSHPPRRDAAGRAAAAARAGLPVASAHETAEPMLAAAHRMIVATRRAFAAPVLEPHKAEDLV